MNRITAPTLPTLPLPVILLAAVFLFGSCPAEDTNTGGTADLVVPADLMGMVHGGSNSALMGNDTNVENNYKTMREIGVKWILNDFGWSSVQPGDQTIPSSERTKLENREANADYWVEDYWDNHVKNANDSGIKILAILDYQANWLHGNPTGEKKIVTDHMGASAELDVYEDRCTGGRCVTGDYEISLFCEYVRRLVTRYDGKHGHGKVDAWRIWNEPNLFPRFWTGTMDQFFTLSKAAAAAIRKADPDAVIVVGSLNSIADEEWIKKLYSSGSAKQANFTAFHPYSPDPLGTEYVFKHFLDNSLVSFRKKVWVTEVGYPTAGNMPTQVPEIRMPQTIVKTVVLLAANGAQKIFWYHLRDNVPRGNDADSENWFGLYEQTAGVLTPKGRLPDAYKLCAENIPGKTFRADGLPGLVLPSSVAAYYFEGSDGKRCLVVWNNSVTSTHSVTITLPAGNNYFLYSPSDPENPVVPSLTGIYQLTIRDSANGNVLFFTWDAE